MSEIILTGHKTQIKIYSLRITGLEAELVDMDTVIILDVTHFWGWKNYTKKSFQLLFLKLI